ncbi:hypothetical protein P5G51_005200 [Virgibacillus sp. 179-BFC.A HS]|uniref:Uncharacterized protein n=1 Tax=Tigheibacillus jepli TaxID=3035914 RepID=A0ABU5CEY2_9BACI|nr:hypothetical protein [Virgibacillus sp. 179-BFC.A HS]MDY0404874.1 hypothetical protein [Virgibacillus sp. 179-BFC.A HS]
MRLKKTLIATLFMIILMCSGISVVFASPNISAILTNWFHTKNEDAIEEIDNAVDKELQKQSARLKASLKPVIDASQKEINTYTKQQKEQKIKELQDYADQLIKHAKEADNSIDKERYENDLNQIVKAAISQLDKVQPKKAQDKTEEQVPSPES